ncbi:MAG: class I SAM-dependent methyltransferase [archaeon]
MSELPQPDVYEQELIYMPYRESLRQVLEYLCSNSPRNASLLDVMCGPGYLLGMIASRRKDLRLKGVDIDERYITHANAKYSLIDFESGNLLSWQPPEQYDVVVCTGALHHIPYEQQETAVKRMASMVKPEGIVLVSDCYVDDYLDETERKVAAAKLGYEYLRATILNGAPQQVVEETIDILSNDVLMKEFKTSLRKRAEVFNRVFGDVLTIKNWPNFESEYGDYVSICRNSNRA